MERDKARKMDRELIARIIKRQILRNREVKTVQGLATASGVSRSTVNDMLAAVERVKPSTFNRVEEPLGLPYDALVTAGQHDLAGLVDMGVSAELVAWIRNEITKSSDTAPRGRKAI
jgi:hypothetical protein